VTRRFARPNHTGGLEAIHDRHQDIEQDDGDVMLQQLTEGLRPRTRHQHLEVWSGQDAFEREDVLLSVIDHENTDRVGIVVLRSAHDLARS
jgi:hypothetical protein